jgi:hypothetical protein
MPFLTWLVQTRAEVLASGKDSLATLNRAHAAEVEGMTRLHAEEVMALEVGAPCTGHGLMPGCLRELHASQIHDL